MNTTKRNYHPLVVFFFYSGMLTEKQLVEIPYTTKKYWKLQNESELFGHSWVQNFSSNQKAFNEITKYKVIFQSARICYRIVDCFAVLLSKKKGLKVLLKENKQILIKTIEVLERKVPLEKLCRIFQITKQKFYRWKNEVHCSASALNRCFKSHSQQLSLKELVIIKDSLSSTLNQSKPRASIYFDLMRNEKLFCGLTTFYRYANLLNGNSKRHKFQKSSFSLRATRIFEYLHIDTTFLQTKNGKRRVAFVKDNFSKVILGCSILPNGKSVFVRNLLRRVFNEFELYEQSEPILIVSDGGTENKGAVNDWIMSLTTIKVKKLIAGIDFPSTNAMSESVHHLFKTYFSPGKIYVDDVELQNELNLFMNFSNNNWYPVQFFGASPMEVMKSGCVNRRLFSDRIKQAQNERIIENGKFSLCCKIQ